MLVNANVVVSEHDDDEVNRIVLTKQEYQQLLVLLQQKGNPTNTHSINYAQAIFKSSLNAPSASKMAGIIIFSSICTP